MKKRIKGIKEKISKVWKDKTSELKLKRSLYKHNYYRAQETWMNMDDERQIYCAKYLPQILMSENGLYIDDILDTLNYTCEEAQALNSQMFTDLIPHMENLEKNGKNGDFNIARAIEGLWGVMTSKAQKQNQEPFEKTIKEHPEYSLYVWTTADEQVKKDNAKLFPNVLRACKTNNEILDCINSTDKSIYQDNIAEIIKDALKTDKAKGIEIYKNIDIEEQENVLLKILEISEEDKKLFDTIYNFTDNDIKDRVDKRIKEEAAENLEKLDGFDIDNLSKEQQQEVERILDIFIKDRYYLRKFTEKLDEHDEIIKGVVEKFGQSRNKLTNKNIIRKVVDLTRENARNLNILWRNVDPTIQENLMGDIIELVTDNRNHYINRKNNILGIMIATNETTQRNKIDDLANLLSGNNNDFAGLWYGISKENKKILIEKLINNNRLLQENPYILEILWGIPNNATRNNYFRNCRNAERQSIFIS